MRNAVQHSIGLLRRAATLMSLIDRIWAEIEYRGSRKRLGMDMQ
jgi:hypothetical protein